MKTTIYCRISSASQTDGVSLDVQLSECKRIAACNGIINSVVVQEVCSAFDRTPPILETLIRKREHRIVFYAVDRFCRNVSIGMPNARLLLMNKCELVFVRERLIIKASTGKEWLTLITLMTQAEAESMAISSRVKGAIAYLKHNGYQYSSHVPYGFKSVQDSFDSRRKRLVSNSEEEKVLRFITLCRTRGEKVSEINKALKAVRKSADKIVIEYPIRQANGSEIVTQLETLMYEMLYSDIAWFLTQNNILYRGKKWTESSVAGVYNRSTRSESMMDEDDFYLDDLKIDD